MKVVLAGEIVDLFVPDHVNTFGFMPPKNNSENSMHFEVHLNKNDGELWQYFIQVPVDIAESLIEGKDRRVICSIDHLAPFHAALNHDGQGGFMITMNAARRKALNKGKLDVLQVKLEKDRSKYGMTLSEELEGVLEQDPEASAIFEKLSSGKRRTLIHWCDNVKSSDIKIRRAFVMCNHIIEQKGRIDFKLLMQEIKEANNREKRR